jgi:hypothetical protein
MRLARLGFEGPDSASIRTHCLDAPSSLREGNQGSRSVNLWDVVPLKTIAVMVPHQKRLPGQLCGPRRTDRIRIEAHNLVTDPIIELRESTL